jgi:hypothetical protein
MNGYLWKALFHPYALSHWMLFSLPGSLVKAGRPVHVIFCMVDHYEPGTGNAGPVLEQGRVDALLEAFPGIAEKHRDSGGNLPKRTWFFPPHYHRLGSLGKLVSLCQGGYGEIELHLHHGKTRPDTPENLEATLEACLEDYARFGIFGSEQGQRRFGFIHGDWALNNSLQGRFCGVNDELSILGRTGCYADFTFPSRGASNPLMINSLFYARGKPGAPKSHSRGTPVRVSGRQGEGPMIIQGPLFPHFTGSRIRELRMWGDIVGPAAAPSGRVDAWVRTGIHVRGRRSWVFVKTHTHGAVDAPVVLGKEVDEVYHRLETEYNDGKDFMLHYVTAREMYNIAKAAEAGVPGDDPGLFRDFRVRPPAYDSSPGIMEASPRLRGLVARTYA